MRANIRTIQWGTKPDRERSITRRLDLWPSTPTLSTTAHIPMTSLHLVSKLWPVNPSDNQGEWKSCATASWANLRESIAIEVQGHSFDHESLDWMGAFRHTRKSWYPNEGLNDGGLTNPQAFMGSQEFGLFAQEIDAYQIRLENIIAALTISPVVIGIMATDGLDSPSTVNGFVDLDVGSERGGHDMLIRGVFACDISGTTHHYALMPQTWGLPYGIAGQALIHMRQLEKYRLEDGAWGVHSSAGWETDERWKSHIVRV